LKFTGVKAKDITIRHVETASGDFNSKISYIDADGVRATVVVNNTSLEVSDLTF
jgi:hypothetical protein